MMFHRDHRHNPTAPIGVILFKLALGVGAAVLKQKLVERLASKPSADASPPDPKKPRRFWGKSE